ncbi:very-long-chain aldehyde decarbonylase CER1-like isoform X2 [Prosopis cineraria]|uniref:very-long-chain aldehyde decarbonylase CER1-like isoform X2 n=1 Tax=Prosopis cineraria TaxID=364024 RepID=UPI00240F21CE|nr:very-long-chain aldehyde decarbonylase CER1-like isoform X2 [Prosopis cineraria]
MASQPGILTDWPWKPLGSFKHMTLAPWVVHTIYSLTTSYERDLVYYLILPMLMARIVHSQIWISVSRHRTAQGKNRIVDRGLEFSQVDRETNWDDNILLTGHIMYIVYIILPEIFHHLPLWRTEGVILMVLLHAGPVEFLYYWLHKALHHHFLYSRYHSHHHSSIVTQPITAVAHPFAEVLAYITLFAIPLFVTLFTKTASGASVYGYLFYIDFMNNLGHCNFEFFPKKLFSLFPFLKYLTYTPSFHSLHHTRFRTNYCLFMPIYDYIYGTVDESTDETYETSLKRPNDSPNVVHLTHLTTLDSIYHLPLGFASLASKPQTSKWYLHFMWPFTFGFIPLAWIFGRTFVSERNTFKKLNLQSWVIPRFTKHYLKGKSTSLNKLIEEAILEAESSGAKVLSLGLLNQVAILYKDKLTKLHSRVLKSKVSLTLTTNYDAKIWLVGDGWDEDEQMKASKGTLFIPYSQFPPKKMRKDCFYHCTPAMMAPLSFTNAHACENWLPRRAMSAWRIAGIVHALEEWNVHECGSTIFNINQIWHASIRHGFQPLDIPF